MLQSKLFTKTRKDVPAEETSQSAQLLVRAGFVHKEIAGVYDYLPLGLRVLNKICNIIREEMNAVGGQEVSLSHLQNPDIWKKSNRWDDSIVDNWFKTNLKNGQELGLGFTHEEALTALLREHVSSYRDLPLFIYQIQTKFRNELRAKSGVMRGREFLMKDMYSFAEDFETLDKMYEDARHSYEKVFNRLGIGEKTYFTFASGGVFSQYSHEFQTLSEAGEDTVFVSKSKNIAINKEVYNQDVLKDLGLSESDLEEERAIEVGNIFKLGTRFSEAIGLNYLDNSGQSKPVVMGSYGIGPSRLMGVIAEVFSDERGLIWPVSVAPFKIHLIEIAPKEGHGVRTHAEKLYAHLLHEGIEVLMDDRDVPAGVKFADADLIGIPYRVVISEKTTAEGKLELKNRKTGEIKFVSEAELSEL